MNFEELRAAVASAQEKGAEVLAKSLAAPAAVTLDNKTIAAAAADGAAAGGATGTTDADPNAEDDDEGKNGGAQPLAKSFSFTLEDGTVIEAEDGTEMLKSFAVRLDAETKGRASDNEEFMKAMGATLTVVGQLTDALKSQGEKLEATNKELASVKTQNETLAKSLAAIGNEGRGRRSVDVTVHGKTTTVPDGQPQKRSAPEILAKAMSALANNVITGIEASQIESALNAGLKPDQSLVDRIFK